MINSRDINALNTATAELCHIFVNTCKDKGIDVIITSTYRDTASQDALYAQGRTTAGAKITNAKGGQSYHNFKVAFDFCPVVNGKAQWNDIDTFTKCGEIAESIGLEWAGRWLRFKELAHCQNTEGKTLAELRNAS